MCRLFAYTTKDTVSTNARLIKSLGEFQVLSEKGCVPCGIPAGHADGWGLVAYKGGVPIFYIRSNDPAHTDPQFSSMIEILMQSQPDRVIAHLRKATRGGTSLVNTQPFLSGNLSYCHNGTMQIPSEILGDKSDSVYFFEDLVRNYVSVDAFSKKHEEYKAKYAYTAMNMLFTDGDSVFVARDWDETNPKKEEQKLSDYYTLFKTSFSQCVFVCSEKLPSLSDGECVLLENKSIITL